jgi:two-component system nitrate/nitrite response regulator NarL
MGGWGMKTVTVQDCDDEQVRVALDDAITCGRLLVVHSHAVVGAGLQLALSERSWDVETTSGPTPTAITDAAHRFRAQCVLTDVHLHHGDGCGISVIEPLVSEGVHVVMLTAERRRLVLAECLEAGAAGWIGLDAGLDEVDLALQNVLAGRPIIGRTRHAELLDLLRAERSAARSAGAIFEMLTPREALVLVALTDGLTADEIAREHFVSIATVRSQIRAVLQKLGVRSQLAAVAIADAHRDLLPQGMASGTDRRQSDRKGRGTEHLLSAHTA